MQSEQEFMADVDRAHKHYVAVRAAAGFPFNTLDPGRALPSWVLRAGERPKTTFVTRSQPAVAKPAATTEQVTHVAKVEQPKVAETKHSTAKTMSKAEQVRAFIREALAANKTIDDVIARAKNELGMGNAQANTYVTENWARVTKE